MRDTSPLRVVLTGFQLAIGYANASQMGVALGEGASLGTVFIHFFFGVALFVMAFAALVRML